MRTRVLFFLLFLPFASRAAEPDTYRVEWTVALEAGVDSARVTLTLEEDTPVERVSFTYDPERFEDFEVSSGELEIEDERVAWEPAASDGTTSLSYRVKVTRARPNSNQEESYDALMTDSWALFRGERITPRIRVQARDGAESAAVLQLVPPEGWSVNTAWPIDQGDAREHVYMLDDPDRSFDRPRGWFIVGRLSVQRAHVGADTLFSIASPLNSGVDKRGWLALVSLVWPELEKAFGTVPAKMLMVSGDDPLWRGGLSGRNSFFFHGSRRAISENGTSPLFHELAHVITRISGDDNDDWIAEGLAEYYGIELLHRAGAYDMEMRAEIMSDLMEWGEEAKKLRARNSTGPITAKAVLVFDALDREIREETAGRANLDAVTRLLMVKRRVSLADLRAAFDDVTGEDSEVLEDIE
jgi:predicted metalloprotease with PDZ domain